MSKKRRSGKRGGGGSRQGGGGGGGGGRSRGIVAEVAGWFRPSALQELHQMLLKGDDAASVASREEQSTELPASRRTRSRAGGFDNGPVIVLLAAAFLLTGMEYGGYSSHFNRWFPTYGHHPYWGELYGLLWWAFVRVLGFIVFPMMVVHWALKERLVDYGLRLKGAAKHLPVYAAMFAIVAPLVVISSFSKSFQHTYPFYNLASRSTYDFFIWELAYFAQFLGVEFFFRGFLLSGTKRQLGVYSVVVSVVPYVMIHYGKPLPETLGAIIAGTVLGVLALRTGSIWAGFLIHVSVALSMDILATLQKVMTS